MCPYFAISWLANDQFGSSVKKLGWVTVGITVDLCGVGVPSNVNCVNYFYKFFRKIRRKMLICAILKFLSISRSLVSSLFSQFRISITWRQETLRELLL